jgi:FAD:protein FMN transferase
MNYKLSLVVLIPLFFSACEVKEKNMATYEGFAQGTTFSIKYFTIPDSVEVFKKGVDSILYEINKTASTYDENSIISKVNRNDEVELNNDFIKIFNRSIEVSDSTTGCFDITVGELVKKWGFGFKTNKMPSKQGVDSLLRFIGYKNLSLNGNKLQKKFPETQIDFNAIAQGYTVDLVAEYLSQNHCNNFIVEIGGEVRASGHKDQGNPWIVGIEKPAANDSSERAIQLKIVIKNQSISTSGNYRKYFIKDGIKYSHTIDPKTGYPVHHSLLSVSIIANDCTTADAYCTAFMVMGLERSKEFLKTHPKMEAYFIYSDSLKGNQVYYTENFFKNVIKE